MTNRIAKLRLILAENHLNAVLISSTANLFYFSGFIPLDVSEREAYVLITDKKAYILTSKLYSTEVKTYISSEFNLLEVTSDEPAVKQIAKVLRQEKIDSLGFEGRNLTFNEHHKLSNEKLKLLPLEFSHLRIEKENNELISISKACKLGDQAFDYILGKIKPGITESELAYEIEIYFRKNLAVPSFPTIVAFGKNAAVPHHVSGDTKLLQNQFVLLDFGSKINNYCSDMTRTVFVGKPDLRQRKIYNAVLKAKNLAAEFINNEYEKNKSVKASEADAVARNYIVKQGFPSFPHSLGHGTGIQVHEEPSLSPLSADYLKKGMVFSVEPGIYLIDDVGVRIEDLVTLENEKLTFLTTSTSDLVII